MQTCMQRPPPLSCRSSQLKASKSAPFGLFGKAFSFRCGHGFSWKREFEPVLASPSIVYAGGFTPAARRAQLTPGSFDTILSQRFCCPRPVRAWEIGILKRFSKIAGWVSLDPRARTALLHGAGQCAGAFC
jgi:hypothetical protein